MRAVFASIRRRAGIPASDHRARCGAVSFVQRFGDALRLNPHFHTLAMDGLYIVNEKGELDFRPVAPPSDAEMARVAERVHRSVARLLERRGLVPEAIPGEADTLPWDQPLLAEIYGASILGQVATGPCAGRRVTKVGDEIDVEDQTRASSSCCASVAGYSVHAGVRISAHNRLGLERLVRYTGRPPLATERLSLLPDGRLLYRLKRSWRDGTSHVIFEPGELVEKLAALVPPPRFNLVRYHGILAPSAGWRPLVVPETRVCEASAHHDCPAGGSETAIAKERGDCSPRNYSWAQLLRRVFEVDVLGCPRCGGRMRILAAINSAEAIHKILDCLGLPTRPPPIAPAACSYIS